MKPEAAELIKGYHKVSDINTQRAELLARNLTYEKELDYLLGTFQLKHILPIKHDFLRSRDKGRISEKK